jgi:chromate transporter
LVSRELVEERRWLDAATFARALNLAMVLPGPEALQVVIYTGWRLYGVLGGIVAGLSFLVPGALLLMGLSYGYVRWGGLAPVASSLVGLKAVVIALVVLSVVQLARRLLQTRIAALIAVISFGLIAVGALPIPAVLALGALAFVAVMPPAQLSHTVERPEIRWRAVGVVILVGLLLWLLTLVSLHRWAPHSTAEQLFLALSRVALGGFGGAYSMVAWSGQLFVQHYGWLTSADLVAGIGLAESTPGPLLLVLQFYGFVSGWLAADAGSPLATATLCAVVASIASFLPSFVLVLAAAPAVDYLAEEPRLKRGLQGVGAAVVGVIATFALGLGRATLWSGGSINGLAVAIALAAGLLLATRRVGLPATLALGVCAGWWFAR